MSFLAADPPSKKDSGSGKVQSPEGILVEIISSDEELKNLVKDLECADVIAFDTETTSTDQMQAELVGISLAVDVSRGYYLPVGHKDSEINQLSIDIVLEALRGPLTDPDIPKIGHNLKYDYVILAREGLKVAPLGFDTMIAEWVINPASRNLGLKKLSWVRLGQEMTEIQDLIGTGKSQITMAEVPVEDAAPYAAADAVRVLQLYPILLQELEEVQSLELFRKIEMPLVPAIAAMEMNGIGLDVDFLKKMSGELNQMMTELERSIFEAVGHEFNLNSPKQLSEALFDTLELEPPDRTNKTSSGYYSTAAEVLERLRQQHQVPEWVLEYREYSKLKSTYVDALQEQVNPATARVHTSYNQTGSVTGRIASSDPNLQNIPIRTEIGRKVRKAFTAQPGWVLLAVDYSQIELRVVAHMAQDQRMLETFRDGKDIHSATAAAIYDIPLTAVDKNHRRKAKAVNFGLIYGMTPYGLTQSTDLTLAEAETFVETYFNRFPGVKEFLNTTLNTAREQGYVETLLGRKRYFPRLKATTNYNIRRREEREAINAPVQGTAADIMKLAMLAVDQALGSSGLDSRILLQVHDELVLEVPEAEIRNTVRLVQTEMEAAYKLDIPLVTDASWGKNWGQLTEAVPD
jgi:DNA polymerase-1